MSCWPPAKADGLSGRISTQTDDRARRHLKNGLSWSKPVARIARAASGTTHNYPCEEGLDSISRHFDALGAFAVDVVQELAEVFAVELKPFGAENGRERDLAYLRVLRDDATDAGRCESRRLVHDFSFAPSLRQINENKCRI
jgi:hypothetical protein